VSPEALINHNPAADLVPTGTPSRFPEGATNTAAHARSIGETVSGGPYTISATLSGELRNYSIDSRTASFTITPAPLTVTAGTYTREFGTPNPLFTVIYGGFVTGEDAAVLGGTLQFTTAATLSTHVGTYPVTPGGVTSTNYAITFVAGSITIVDTTAPVLVCTASTPALWSPNNDLASVGLTASSIDAHDGTVSYAMRVFSNERDAAGNKPFSPDANGSGSALRLRAERTGSGDGRVYLVTLTTSDAAGNQARKSCAVVVSHDQSAKSTNAVNAAAAAAVSTFDASGAVPAGYVQVGVGPVLGPKQ
jgi:hypothetical protein